MQQVPYVDILDSSLSDQFDLGYPKRLTTPKSSRTEQADVADVPAAVVEPVYSACDALPLVRPGPGSRPALLQSLRRAPCADRRDDDESGSRRHRPGAFSRAAGQ